jgi:Uncharacterised nucleotidyltransferase
MMHLLSSQETEQLEESGGVASGSWRSMGAASKTSRGRRPLREAALLVFCDPPPQHCAHLKGLSSRQWRSLLCWLDYSGLALYFLDRMQQLGWVHWIPGAALARLQRNQADNAERTWAMLREAIAIHTCFQHARLTYAILKGISLSPHSAPRPELRSQFDLDFLVAEPDVLQAWRILESRGYRLYSAVGRSLEFKFNEKPGISLKELYKNQPSFAVELHLEPKLGSHRSILRRTGRREILGASIPVLSPVDLLLGQGLHAFKHLCGEFTRASHLLEFRRHVLTRYRDNAFWANLRVIGEEIPGASVALGTVILLITGIMGEFAPDDLTSWTVCRVPKPVRLWVDLYGRRAVLGSIPGSKLYLLLQGQLEQKDSRGRPSVRRKLFPLKPPLPIIRPFPNETLAFRLSRYRMQLQHCSSRLRFHVVEGIRYAWHAYWWRQWLSQLTP